MMQNIRANPFHRRLDLHYSQDNELTVTFFSTFHDHDKDYSYRVSNQFKRLKLNILYSVQASSELEDIRLNLTELHRKKGKDGVASRLQEDLESFSGARPNSWKSAMYRALLADCDFKKMNWIL